MATPATKLTYDDYLLLPEDGKRYEHFGVREYWILDPDENSLEIFRLEHQQLVSATLSASPGQCSSPLFPHLAIDLGWLFKN